MKFTEAQRVKIRTLINVAGERIPFFWPMRNFIHHNPLYGLEDLLFEEAVKLGKKLFRAQTLPAKSFYLKLLKEGEVEEGFLREELRNFLGNKPELEELFWHLLTSDEKPILSPGGGNPEEIFLKRVKGKYSPQAFSDKFRKQLGREISLEEAVDNLFGTHITEKLNEELCWYCASFLDEGQSVLPMPLREEGFFATWKALYGDWVDAEIPEEAVFKALEELRVPEEILDEFITFELAKLHGWSGFIRWRSSTKEYYWNRKHPATLIDYVAVRLLTYIKLSSEAGVPYSYEALLEYVERNPEESFLRWEYYSGSGLPKLYDKLEKAIEGYLHPKDFVKEYQEEKEQTEALSLEEFTKKIFKKAGLELSERIVEDFLNTYEKFKEEEGLIWLKAHERTLIRKLVSSLRLKADKRENRAFAQALFCIDVRSERFRRNLEKIGDYETYGIAGFFGVPISFIELGKGHETYLCPVLIKPKNVVVEVHRDFGLEEEEDLKEVLKEIIHDLKNNVFTPYITVEAIGLLFGFDMVGKTLIPLEYSKVRNRIEREKEPAKLIVDKLSREEAEEIVKVFQREIIVRFLERELGRKSARLEKDLVEELRLLAMEEGGDRDRVKEKLRLSDSELDGIIWRLRRVYQIEQGYARLWLEKLAKIGFTLEEQATYVEKALKMIGLTDRFGKFVLVIGHGSTSDNNPYESALDCGACGGDHGLVNARVFCAMANKKEVREKLKERGINIPEDTVFIPGEHDTTRDEVRFYDLDYLSPAGIKLFEKVIEDFRIAGKLTAFERCKELPFSDCSDEEKAFKEVLRNSVDWTQVRPEWGLSGNWAFIIGKRSLTEGVKLDGKVFLHSYNYKIDSKGFLLENILSGPMVVGEWINMEHFFSTVDNDHFGSGSKVYHNVVGRFGVMTGNLSDLRTGLPAQTVLRGKEYFHKPVRLIVFIEAPRELVESVVKRVWKVRELVVNGWINLVVYDPEEGKVLRFYKGTWEVLHEEA